MVRRRRRKKRYKRRAWEEELPRLELRPETKRAILIVVLLLLAVLSVLALFDGAGALGQIVDRVLALLLGQAAIVAPLIFFGMAVALVLAARRQEEEQAPVSNLRVYLGGALFTVALTGLFQLLAMRERPSDTFALVKEGVGGGYFGILGAFPLFNLIDFWASVAVLVAALLVAVIVLFNLQLNSLARRTTDSVQQAVNHAKEVKINKLDAAGFNVAEVGEKARAEDEEADKPVIQSYDERAADKAIDYERVQDRFRKGQWKLPGIDLLEDSHSVVDSGNIEANINIIQKTLADFGIPVEMSEVNVGPTVTQYTLRPAQGIKLSQIVALQNDLALALAAPSIRIEAPIPGRSLVGIEVPNKATAIVRLKDTVQTEAFLSHKSNLAFALGRDVAGRAVIGDLARMPHLLIAGATGTGKSVAINSMLVSFLFRNAPEELRLIVIDPKRVELVMYNGIPHLLTQVVTDYKQAVNALKWAVSEMDRRYQLLSESGRRNIAEYNQKASEPLPYVVIVVDELADLMAVAQADVEAAVVRLAQMARAVGVHLVLATQRPSVDIITGLIKANITARVAFAVASQVDSRTILDAAGAERLLGSGDMLFVTADLGKPRRIQGTYIAESEVKNIVDFVRSQAGEVDYAEEILEKQKISPSLPGIAGAEDEDEMLEEAVAEVRRAGKASASLLQRRLRIGYARAARLLDLMEERGMIGPAEGAKPRDVYISDEEE